MNVKTGCRAYNTQCSPGAAFTYGLAYNLAKGRCAPHGY